MIKQFINYFAIPLAISAALFSALKTNTSVDISKYSTEGLELDYNISEELAFNFEKEEKTEKVIDNELSYVPFLGKTYHGFKEAVAFKESRGNYFTVNTLGYLGKYQFGTETLKLIGIYSPNQFLYTPELQEKAFLANAQRNKWILRKDIKKYVGKKIGGVIVTESGILAAAHLAGPGSVKKFLRSYGSQNFEDAYGSSVRYYMKRFAGYDTSFITPNQRAKVTI